jgi:hypothetical protein
MDSSVWLLELAKSQKSSIDISTPSHRGFHGYDISDMQFPRDSDLPEGLTDFKFTRHDCLQPFPKEVHGKYDIVHVRLLVQALKESEYSIVVRNLYELLRMFFLATLLLQVRNLAYMTSATKAPAAI